MEKYLKRLLRKIRQEWSRSNPDRRECLKKSRVKQGDFEKFKCTICNNVFSRSEVQVDHIDPVSNTVPCNIPELLESVKRLHSDKLQVLCIPCHRFKTRQDAFHKRHTEALVNVSTYLQAYPSIIQHFSESTLQKFHTVIKKIKADPKNPRLQKTLDNLTSKYL